MNTDSSSRAFAPVAFGFDPLDARLRHGLARAALHDLYAEEADAAAATGFALLLAARAQGARPVCVVRDDRCVREFGRMHGAGLADLGLDPAVVVLVHAADMAATLCAAGDAARCPDIGALIVQPWRTSPLLDLTATRRLALRVERSGVFTLIVRVGIAPAASAAATRWQVRAAPSTALAANAPGPPAFDISLLRHRRGVAGFDARVEWDRDQGRFRAPPLPRAVPAVAAGRARDPGERRAA